MTSSYIQWKEFNFFNKNTLQHDLEETLKTSISCGVTDYNFIIYGDIYGYIYITESNNILAGRG